MRLETETVVAATDYVLGAAAFAWAFALSRDAARRDRRSVVLWAAGFAGIGAAAFLGGTWHAAHLRLAPPVESALWKATLASAGLAGFFLIAGAAFASLRDPVAKAVTAWAAVKLGLFTAWALPGDAFEPVIFDSAGTLAALLGLQSFAYLQRREPSAPWVLAGVGVSAAAAAIEAIRPEFPAPFGADAAYHLVQLVGLFFFYRGGRLFEKRGG